MTDFTPGFKIRNANLIKNISYMNHIIGDGERPDVTSHMLYGTTAYHWTFFIVNDYLRNGISEWPLGQNELDRYVSSKYDNSAVIMFDPRVIPDATYGNLSYVPFKQYEGSLYLVAYDEGDVEVARCMIQTYDTLSCQMILTRDTFDGDGTIDQFVNNYDAYKIVSTDETFNDALSAAYETEDASGLLYAIAKDSQGNNLNYELMKNATYMFYDSIHDESISLSAYDVIDGGNLYTNVSRITYAEMEETLNNRKRTISVINPANISRFVQSYFDVLNNG